MTWAALFVPHESRARFNDDVVAVFGMSDLFTLPITSRQQRGPDVVEADGVVVKEILSLTAQRFGGVPAPKVFSAPWF